MHHSTGQIMLIRCLKSYHKMIVLKSVIIVLLMHKGF